MVGCKAASGENERDSVQQGFRFASSLDRTNRVAGGSL